MQKRVQRKTDDYFQDFKQQIKSQLQQDFPFISTGSKSADFNIKQEDIIKTKIFFIFYKFNRTINIHFVFIN